MSEYDYELQGFKTLLQDISRKLDDIGKLLQRLVDAQEVEGYTVKIGELDRRLDEYLNWTGQDDDSANSAKTE